jgi:Glyoxalase/Bleomycin resistance protein/Dioxygenase superfamily
VSPPRPNRRVMQASWVVPDLREAALNWVRTTGIGPFLQVPDIKLDTIRYRGGAPGPIHFSVALAQAGDLQIELVQQHCDHPSAYRDLVNGNERGFHHLAVYCQDYDADLAFYIDGGFQPAVEGMFGDMRFAYIDTSATIGCMIELIEHHPLQDDFFARIRAAADGWDGVTDPIRPGFPP